jgi:TPR repeat protein
LTILAKEALNVGMKRFLAALLLLTLAVVQPNPAIAGIIEGVAAYNRGDYATALRELRPLVEEGHARAKAIIWFMYLNREGMNRDDAQAFKDTALKLGSWATDQGVSEAVKWYRKAAGQGVAWAQATLGFMYHLGQGH